jgi:hypothetical protein
MPDRRTFVGAALLLTALAAGGPGAPSAGAQGAKHDYPPLEVLLKDLPESARPKGDGADMVRALRTADWAKKKLVSRKVKLTLPIEVTDASLADGQYRLGLRPLDDFRGKALGGLCRWAVQFPGRLSNLSEQAAEKVAALDCKEVTIRGFILSTSWHTRYHSKEGRRITHLTLVLRDHSVNEIRK